EDALDEDALEAEGDEEGGAVAAETEEEEEEEEEPEDEDVEASLDEILKERLVVADEEDEEEDEDEPPDPEERAESATKGVPKRPDEFVRQSCFPVKPPSQLAGGTRMLRRACV